MLHTYCLLGSWCQSPQGQRVSACAWHASRLIRDHLGIPGMLRAYALTSRGCGPPWSAALTAVSSYLWATTGGSFFGVLVSRPREDLPASINRWTPEPQPACAKPPLHTHTRPRQVTSRLDNRSFYTALRPSWLQPGRRRQPTRQMPPQGGRGTRQAVLCHQAKTESSSRGMTRRPRRRPRRTSPGRPWNVGTSPGATHTGSWSPTTPSLSWA